MRFYVHCLTCDAELDTLITDLRRDLSYSGQRVILGYLQNIGHHTTRVQMRDSVRRTDPLNIPQRWGGDMHRRVPYFVPGPNSLWHLGECGCRGLCDMHVQLHSTIILFFHNLSEF